MNILEAKKVRRPQKVQTTRRDFYHNADDWVKRFIIQSGADAYPDELYWSNSKLLSSVEPIIEPYKGIVNFQRINDIQRINKYLEDVNRNLQEGQYLLVNMETKESRKVRILNKYPRAISRPYYALDFVLKRVFPKWKPTKKIYFWITKGSNRVLSLTEGLGRLISCGFEIVNYERNGHNTYIIARKVDKPAYDMEPTYGALVKLRRIGKDGKLFDVYKMRTMHPYSEYLQDFAYKKSSLQNGGKIKDDFRITGWGSIFRKLWIDELPMLINYFRRDMKLVGVRPLSRHYFNLYPEDVQMLRTSVKPGLVPPFYADLPKTLEEIIESERTYIEAYIKNPLKTDIKYFFKAMYNIFIKKARSS